jgi:nucleotide-binding universal stress UspA family protein
MTVVVGYIPTPEGEAALAHAIEEAQKRQTRLVVVNSSKGDALVDPRYALDDQVDRLRSSLEAAAVDHDVIQSVRGREAAEEVIDAVEQHRAELVVIGLRRRTAVGKLILGSTAQRILLGSPCPVLAVKAPH